MREGIHPDYHPVAHEDSTGQMKIVDSAGRVERFNRRYGRRRRDAT